MFSTTYFVRPCNAASAPLKLDLSLCQRLAPFCNTCVYAFCSSSHKITLTNISGVLEHLNVYVYIEYTGHHGALVHICGPSPHGDTPFLVSVNLSGTHSTVSQPT